MLAEGTFEWSIWFYKGTKKSNSCHDLVLINLRHLQIYHPNIQADGNICLNILREDWKPVLTLNSVMVGLQYLLLEPNADDPLNKEAAEDLRNNRRNFEANVHKSIRGGSVNGVQYDNVMSHK